MNFELITELPSLHLPVSRRDAIRRRTPAPSTTRRAPDPNRSAPLVSARPAPLWQLPCATRTPAAALLDTPRTLSPLSVSVSTRRRTGAARRCSSHSYQSTEPNPFSPLLLLRHAQARAEQSRCLGRLHVELPAPPLPQPRQPPSHLPLLLLILVHPSTALLPCCNTEAAPWPPPLLSSPWPERHSPPLPQPSPQMASPRPQEAPRPLHGRPKPPEHRRRCTAPPPPLTRHGPAASEHPHPHKGPLQVRLELLSISPNLAPAAGASPCRKQGRNPSSVPQCPSRDPKLKEAKFSGG